jgi:amiloride-sensitive sodium channel
MLGLTVFLYPDAYSYDDADVNNYVGFKVLVHSPYDFAEVAGKGFSIGKTKEAFIAVGAQYTESSEVVKAMSLEKRNCLKHDEDMSEFPHIIMEAFSNYSRKACLLECQAREMFKQCGCLPYYMPDFKKIWKKNTNCDLAGLKCLSKSADETKALTPKLAEGQAADAGLISGSDCECPNDCEETLYFQEMSQADLKEDSRFFKRMHKPKNVLWHLNETIHNTTKDTKRAQLQAVYDDVIESSSLVHIYFKELGIVKYSRDELYGIMDVIAACGGIVGLCMGFSLISGVELIYWFTLRLYFDYFRSTKKK